MRVKMILPALIEASGARLEDAESGRTKRYRRPIKYSLFPPLGLATLAAYLPPDTEVSIHDEHVQPLRLDEDPPPDLVAIQVYITSARRSYEIADHYRARGSCVVLGGLHVTSLPEEAARHADVIFLGPGEETWPQFLREFDLAAWRRSRRVPRTRYSSSGSRTLVGLPPVRRDLIDRTRYLVPNSIVVSRGCPHHCDFCYKDAFFEGGRGFCTQTVDEALAEIDRLPGRHLYFLDDHLFGNRRFAEALFDGMVGGGRLWQAAGTVDSVLRPGLLEKAVRAGLRSLFVGFESINGSSLAEQRKRQNLGRDYSAVVRRLHDAGVMVNASFVFGMDGDGPDVFDRTVDWAIEQGIETATFHIMTPYPGTALYRRLAAAGRIWHQDWDRYDTRHVVFTPQGMTPTQLEAGYWRAYRDFYRWSSIWRSAATKPLLADRLRHLAYSGGWKKFEPLWDLAIRTRQVLRGLPLLEATLAAFGSRPSTRDTGARRPAASPRSAADRRAPDLTAPDLTAPELGLDLSLTTRAGAAGSRGGPRAPR